MFAPASSKKNTVGNELAGARVEPARKIDASGNNPMWQTLAFGSVPIQRKLAVSQPDDPYEREADRVADHVMRMHDPAASSENLVKPVGPSDESVTNEKGRVAALP